MLELIEKEKEVLKKRSASYEEALKEALSVKFRETTHWEKAGLIGGGLIFASFLAGKFLNNTKALQKSGVRQTGPGWSNADSIPDTGLRNEFKEQMVIVLLEILRQGLLIIAEKIKPADGKQDI